MSVEDCFINFANVVEERGAEICDELGRSGRDDASELCSKASHLLGGSP